MQTMAIAVRCYRRGCKRKPPTEAEIELPDTETNLSLPTGDTPRSEVKDKLVQCRHCGHPMRVRFRTTWDVVNPIMGDDAEAVEHWNNMPIFQGEQP